MPRLAELLRQMEQQRQPPAAPLAEAMPVAPPVEVPPAPRPEEKEEEREELHHVHVELTSEQLQRLIDAVVPEVMSAEQLARYLQKGKGWVSKMARSGHIPAVRMGNSWRFVRKTVEEWLLGKISDSAGEKSRGNSNK